MESGTYLGLTEYILCEDDEPMRCGKLRHRVDIERAVLTRDALGGVVATWLLVDSPFAEIVPVEGGEGQRGGKTEPKVTHEIRIRYPSSITSKDRIRWNGKTFSPQSIINEGTRNRTFLISAGELV